MRASSWKKNAIERRLDDLGGRWNEFAMDPKARLLRWLADAEASRMLDVFLEMQAEEAGDSPDLFVRFEIPFEDPRRHGFALLEAMRAKYEETRSGLAEEGIASDWTCPAPRSNEPDVAAFARACLSFREHYATIVEHFVAVMEPGSISNASAWEAWLRALVRSGLPEHVRIMVVDEAGAPALDALAEDEPDRVVTVAPDLDMPGAMEELVHEAGGAGPGVAFRRHFVALTSAATAGDLARVTRSGEAALRIARAEGWSQLQVVIHMALGGVFLGAGKMADALASYRAGTRVSADASAAGDPAGPKLLVQSRFAEGAVLVADNRHAEAATVYEAAAPQAAAQQDTFMAMEGWRMAAYCHEVAREAEPAWRCGHLALGEAERLDEPTRKASTVPYIGHTLLRLTRERAYTREADAVRSRMVKLLGPGWEQPVEQGSATP